MPMRPPRLSLLSILAILPLAACVETAVIGGVAAVGSTALQERGIKGAATDLGIRAQINDAWLRADQIYMRDLNLQVYPADQPLTASDDRQFAMVKPFDDMDAIQAAIDRTRAVN